ncbi:ABC transporter permease [Paenibacillus pinisoli]|uniref:ABC transporter permease n=1 Tax=Paenibacillus pinisoli TaxID=1276110 RepID=A0A3A6Q3Y6_9BACL|nr:FtsX-like permease family protein [Paenibacillus pinisoli]RJX40624.1 ABC transporter permease [Paenibacillus pinisoli]
MRPNDLLRMAWGQISRRKVVTLLCMIGLSVGCAAIILAISISSSAQAQSIAEMNRTYKMDEITVSAKTVGGRNSGSAFDRGAMTMQKLDVIKRLPHVTAVLPQVNVPLLEMYTMEDKSVDVQVIGTDLTMLSRFGYAFAEGGVSTMPDTVVANYGASFGLMDPKTKKDLIEKLSSDPYNDELYMKYDELGRKHTKLFQQQIHFRQTMNINNANVVKSSLPLRIRGVLQVKDGSSEEYSIYDKQLYVSLDTAILLKERFGDNSGTVAKLKLDSLTVKVEDKRYVAQVERLIGKLYLNTQSNLFQEKVIQEKFATFKKTTLGIGIFILMLASLSIFVAMTMSTHQRRRQIGVMKILGANLWQIRQLFVGEAAVLGLMGGIAGIAIAYLAVAGLNRAVATGLLTLNVKEVSISLSVLPVGIGFALLTGIFTGIYPAISASRTNALEVIKNG